MRTIDSRASIIPRRVFNRDVQFALRPAHFLPLDGKWTMVETLPSFPTINNPWGDESYFSFWMSLTLTRFTLLFLAWYPGNFGAGRGVMMKVNLWRFNDEEDWDIIDYSNWVFCIQWNDRWFIFGLIYYSWKIILSRNVVEYFLDKCIS